MRSILTRYPWELIMQSGVPLFPERASTIAQEVDYLYFFLNGLTAFFTLLISGLIIYFAIRYRRRSEDEKTIAPKSSLLLEISWIVIPTLIMLIPLFWGISIMFRIARPPADAMDVYVIGKQWMWYIQHTGGQREINQLHVPVGRAVRLTMTSQDVIHSFYVPAFRIKADVLPNNFVGTWFEATKTGSYHLFCAEYCGTNHSRMIGTVTVMEPAEYEAWLANSGSDGSLAAEGQKLFQQLKCISCHRNDSEARGPNLAGVFGREVLLDDGSKITADPNYIRESILNPRAKVVAGYQPIMPTFDGLVNEEQMVQVVAYIKWLGTGEAPLGLSEVPPGSLGKPVEEKNHKGTKETESR